jgi:hypothetical protein
MNAEYDPSSARRLDEEMGMRKKRDERARSVEIVENPAAKLLLRMGILVERLGRKTVGLLDLVTPIEETLTDDELDRRLKTQVELGHDDARKIETQYSEVKARAVQAVNTLREFEENVEAVALLSKAVDAMTILTELKEFEDKHSINKKSDGN